MSQAPGLSGTPDSGHCRRAATSASCARSSATPTSRTIRARPAISLADSIRQTASIARWVSAALTSLLFGVFGHLRTHASFRVPQLGGERLAEIICLENLTDLDLGLLAKW